MAQVIVETIEKCMAGREWLSLEFAPAAAVADDHPTCRVFLTFRGTVLEYGLVFDAISDDVGKVSERDLVSSRNGTRGRALAVCVPMWLCVHVWYGM